MPASASTAKVSCVAAGGLDHHHGGYPPEAASASSTSIACAVDRVRLLGRVADRGHAEPAGLGQRRHHVEDDAGLARLVEVEPVAHDDVEQVVGGEPAVRRVLDVVARDEVLLAARSAR